VRPHVCKHRQGQTVPSVAAIVYQHNERVEQVMAAIAHTLRRASVRVAGLLQHNGPAADGGASMMDLEDIVTGRRFRLTQDLGAGSQSCRLDVSGLADATQVLREALRDQADLVLVNKFGAQEAQGRGLRDEIAAAAMAGIPVLTTVRRELLAQWREFAGGEFELLPPEETAVLCWWTHVRCTAAPAAGLAQPDP